MQSSVRSETPRLVTISATPSSTSLPRDGSVQVDREVTVMSSTRIPPKPATYSPIPPTSRHSITSSHDLNSSQPYRRRDSSRMSSRSAGHESRYSFLPPDASELATLDSNRDGMKALVEFLRTKEPPPNNWISFTSDEETDHKSHTLSALQIFSRKQKKRKRKAPKPTRFLRLPDSAVAATTREGSRHIAISIPIEHDLLDVPRSSFHSETRYHPPPRSYTLERPERAAVTVLKPVAELRESSSSYLPKTADSRALNDPIEARPTSIATPPAVVLGPDATRTLENYYTQLNMQQRQFNAEGKKPETARPARNYVRVPPTDLIQDSQRGDPRSSSGTAYSSFTAISAPGHSRGVSSTSTAPSLKQKDQRLRVDLPPRKSSRSTNPQSLGAELHAYSERVFITEQAEDDVSKSMSGNEELISRRSTSQSPPTVFAIATAKTARSYSAVGPQMLRSRTPQASASASAKEHETLPVRSATAPPSSDVKILQLPPTVEQPTDVPPLSPKSRQERVKARKERDMQALRARNLGLGPLSGRDVEQAPLQTGNLQESKHHISSQDLRVKQTSNTLSTIMIVANLAPFVGTVLASDLPTPPPRSSARMATSPKSELVRTHTPPQSLTDSFSDSDTIPHPPSQAASSKKSSPIVSIRSAALDTRRQERRAKRNMSLHEKELDARLSKIERDNALLLNTLSGIASSFGQLNRLIPGARLPSGLISSSPLANGKNLQRVESFQRELQYGAADQS